MHLSMKREVVQQLDYTHGYASLMVSRYTTQVPFLGLHIDRMELSAALVMVDFALHTHKNTVKFSWKITCNLLVI